MAEFFLGVLLLLLPGVFVGTLSSTWLSMVEAAGTKRKALGTLLIKVTILLSTGSIASPVKDSMGLVFFLTIAALFVTVVKGGLCQHGGWV